jgi:hypothetical protein
MVPLPTEEGVPFPEEAMTYSVLANNVLQLSPGQTGHAHSHHARG